MDITRREMISGALATAAAGSLAGAAEAADRRPNIIFIMADDLGYADVSCYGRREYRTVHIDRLANEGVRLTQAYANSPVCSATRLALITGRYQYRLRAGLEEPLLEKSDLGLPPDHPTLPSVLRAAGYHTGLIGKWHLGSLPNYGPLKSGYDEFWGIHGGGVDYFSHDLMGQKDLWDGATPIEQAGYMTDLLGQKAVDFVERQRGATRPFLLSLHFTAPHWPWEGPDDEAESRRLSQSRTITSTADFDGGSMATYAQMVLRMDDHIGRLLDALDRHGMARDTIVVFTSDNGGERFSDVWPFTGRKGELLEGGLRVPAIVRWPGRIAQASTSDQVTMSMDWMPTLLSAAGIDPPLALDGRDVLLNLLGRQAPFERELFWRYLNFDQEACRSGRWKYLKIMGNAFLFDVVADPLERANLKEREPEIFARLASAYQDWNATMLPLDPAAFTHGFSGQVMPDHFGVDAPVMHRHARPKP